MATLRKMMGDMDSPECAALMKIMETQSKNTLTSWAAAYAQKEYLPIYEKWCPENSRLREIAARCEDFTSGKIKIAELKPDLKEAREIAAQTEHPTAQAAARAVATACATANTPSNAFGFLLYGAAAAAYDCLGLEAATENYNRAATESLRKALTSLEGAAVANEAKPANIKWNC